MDERATAVNAEGLGLKVIGTLREAAMVTGLGAACES
jgi:hypothetical protein